jgi:hypothetical protein
MITSIDDTIISRMVLEGSCSRPSDHAFETAEAPTRRVGVERAHRPVMACVHDLQQVEGLRSAHFAHDDAVGAHTQAVLDEVAHGDLALAFELGRARLESHHMRLLQLELRGVFASDGALVTLDIGGDAVE